MTMTASEIRIAVKMTGEKSYGQYTFLLRSGLITPPPIEEIRARLVVPKKDEPAKYVGKEVICYDLKGEFVVSYQSVKAAAEKLGIKGQGIYDCCTGRAKSSRGFQWRYAEDDPPGVYEKPKSAPVKIPAKKPLQDKVCKVCGETFKGVGSAKYCSEACRRKGRQTQKTEYMRGYRQKIKKSLVV